MFTKIMAIQQPASVPVRPVPQGILPQIEPIVTELKQIIPRLEAVSPTATDSATIITGIKDASKFLRIMQQISVVTNGLMKAEENRALGVGKSIVGPVCFAIANCGGKNDNEKALVSLFRRLSPTNPPEINDEWFLSILPFFFFSTDGNAKVPSKSELLGFCGETKTRMEQIHEELFKINSRIEHVNGLVKEGLEKQKAVLYEEIDTLFETIKTSPKEIPMIYKSVALKACFNKEILDAYIMFFKSVKELLIKYANNTEGTVVIKMPVIAENGTVRINNLEIHNPKQFVDEMGLSDLLRIFIGLRTIMKESSKNILFDDVQHGKNVEAQKAQNSQVSKLKKDFSECTLAVSAIAKLVMGSDMTTLEKFAECTNNAEIPGATGMTEVVYPFLRFNIAFENELKHNSELLTTVIEQYFKATPEERIGMDGVLREIVEKKPILQKAIKLIKEIGTKNANNDFSGVSITLNDGVESFLKKKSTGDDSSLFNIALLHVLHLMSSDKELVRRYKNTILNLAELSSASVLSGYSDVGKVPKEYISEIIQKLCSTLKDFYGHHDLVKKAKRSVDIFLAAWKDPSLLQRYTPAELLDSILLHGEPGTGKTFFAFCLANEYGFALKTLDVSEIVKNTSNEGDNNTQSVLKRIDEIFESAAKDSKERPVLLFIDEFDGISMNRKNSTPEERMVTNYILTKFDEIRAKYPGILIVTATNHPEDIDAGALREGRAEIHLEIELPDLQEHEEMIKGILKDETTLVLTPEEITKLAEASRGLPHNSVSKAILQVLKFNPQGVNFNSILESIEFRRENRIKSKTKEKVVE